MDINRDCVLTGLSAQAIILEKSLALVRVEPNPIRYYLFLYILELRYSRHGSGALGSVIRALPTWRYKNPSLDLIGLAICSNNADCGSPQGCSD